jgi:superfamily II DNA/RNA helicase
MAKHLPYIQIEYAVRDRNLSKPNEYKKGKRLIDIPIVIGTPGTVEDWARKLKIIDLKKLDMFVIIDEASSLINTGNFSQICFDLVKNRLRKDCQTMFFTSTYSNEVC